MAGKQGKSGRKWATPLWDGGPTSRNDLPQWVRDFADHAPSDLIVSGEMFRLPAVSEANRTNRNVIRGQLGIHELNNQKRLMRNTAIAHIANTYADILLRHTTAAAAKLIFKKNDPALKVTLRTLTRDYVPEAKTMTPRPDSKK